VQLLGSIDDYVAPNDNIDLVSGGEFVYLGVPSSGHKSVAQDAGRLDQFATETASYGFFPMLPFLVGNRRREKVEWLDRML
jgi:hypothetical protein